MSRSSSFHGPGSRRARRMALLATAMVVVSYAAAAAPGQRIETALDAQSPVDFEVFLPLRNTTALATLLAAQKQRGSAAYHKWLTPAEFGARFGPAPAAIGQVEAALRSAGLQITAVHTRSLHVAGTAGQVGATFATSLKAVQSVNGSRDIVAASKLTLPAALAQAGVVVAAFTGIPDSRSFSQKFALPTDRHSVVGPYDYDGLKQAYDYPSYQSKLPNGQRLDGTGVDVAVLIDTNALNSDIAAMFNFEGFTATTGKQPPTIRTLNVDGGAPFDPNRSTEASLDVQQILGGAPGASVTLVSVPDLSQKHIIDGYLEIVERNQWDLVNSSFGLCELAYFPAYNNGVDFRPLLRVYDEVFQQGSAQGITFVASSGDSGGLSCPSLNYIHGGAKGVFIASVENPADDPNVTAVGGTNLITSPPDPMLTSAYVGENFDGDPEVPYDPFGLGHTVAGGYWGAGGGRSAVFAAPDYQSAVVTDSKARTIPDVGMQVGGCPLGLAKLPCGPNRSAAIVTIAGARFGVIGTSVSSPEFVGALALFQEFSGGGRLGNVNSYLYGASATQNLLGAAGAPAVAQFYHKNIGGFDGFWRRYREQYNYAVGNGTPDVRRLFGMQNLAPAGDSRTPSNP